MNDHDVFWKLEALSDRELLERLGSVLGSSRRLMAELLAHLGEVEERRLHLVAACSSMFAYCVKLGMTEDEAYRRIEVARLARSYPAIFPLLADGQLTISAVALLKHHLSEENHVDLLAAIAGRTVMQARELIAARFPRPDVTSSVRKLPERRTVVQPSLAMWTPPEPLSGGTEARASGTEPGTSTGATETQLRTGGTAPRSSGTEACGTESRADTPAPSTGVRPPPHSQQAAPTRGAPRIEPLSAERYKVQFTASAELARKLELARDLMRHSHPAGDLGPIVERALDQLIASLMQRRFGKSNKENPKRTSVRAPLGDPQRLGHVIDGRSTPQGTAEPDTSAHAGAEPITPEHATGAHEDTEPLTADGATTTTLDTMEVQGEGGGERTRTSLSSYIPRSTRRTVVERDALGCSWVDEHGVRCGSQAWLEYDHRCPRAKGGGSRPDNLRLLCRSHNRFAAEQAYGREHVDQSIAKRRRERASHATWPGPGGAKRATNTNESASDRRARAPYPTPPSTETPPCPHDAPPWFEPRARDMTGGPPGTSKSTDELTSAHHIVHGR